MVNQSKTSKSHINLNLATNEKSVFLPKV